MTSTQFHIITDWQDKIFTKATPLSCVNHLEEEVKELREKTEQGILDKHECNQHHLKYEDVVSLIWEKFAINQTRNWGKVNDKGHVKHIEDGKQ